ncbi:MAG: AsnC family protein [Neisseriaceae bacterium]|nr:AsnC family protein [Neisseriaceae bacterium]
MTNNTFLLDKTDIKILAALKNSRLSHLELAERLTL